ncbi:MAG: DNA repair protein RadA, partial [Saccharopolyspora sp.]|nr:DNA repair protein RadA [Saccharopolyspora sp.]
MPAKNARAARPAYRCADCGHEVTKWLGRCPSCHAWNTIEETAAARPAAAKVTAAAPATSARPIAEVDLDSA